MGFRCGGRTDSTGHQAINYVFYRLSVQKTGVPVLHWGDNPVSLTFLISPVPICESSALLSTSGQLSNKVSGLVYCPNCCNQIDPSKPVNEGRIYFWLYPGGYPPVWQGRRSVAARAGGWLVMWRLQLGSTAWTGSRARLENPLPLERSTSECSTTFPRVPPFEDKAFKHMSLCGIFPMQTVEWVMRKLLVPLLQRKKTF